MESKERLLKAEAKEKATYDYIQARLIIKGISICLGDKSDYPNIEDVYNTVFADVIEERKQERERKEAENKQMLSILRFKQFANFHNSNFKK